MTALLWVCAALTVCLTGYALGHYLCIVVFFGARPKPRKFPDYPTDAVSVLVPARNEGEQALRVIGSLVSQDHRGPIRVTLLVKDRDDTSIPFFRKAFPGADWDAQTEPYVELLETDDRRVTIAFAGSDPKHDKINWATPQLATPFMAILDCDHQADPAWIRSSLCLLREQGARIVQGRRHPLSAQGFFGLWDALHQHIGCELFNTAFTGLDLTVFFTGTTVVMETSLLRNYPLRPCITEDVDFSYGALHDGVKLIHNPHHGSDEEVSPDLYSFLARRRRWSNGHTEAFFRHLPNLWSPHLSLADRVQFLLHGVHYLVVLPVFALHGIIGLYFLSILTTSTQIAAVAASVIIALLIARTQRSIRWGTWLSEVAVVLSWIGPAVVIVMNLAQAALLHDLGRASLPLPPELQVLGLVGFLAPLAVLIAGMAGFGQLGLGSLFTVVLTYPVAFYLDLSGVLIGLTDYLTGRQLWKAVARAPQPTLPDRLSLPTRLTPVVDIRRSWQLETVLATTPTDVQRATRALMKASRWVPITALLAIFCGGVLYAPTEQIRIEEVDCQVLEHDGDPWIVPAARLEGYCEPASGDAGWSTRTGSFEVARHDDLTEIDPTYWDKLDDTYFCNESIFAPENIEHLPAGGIRLHLKNETKGERDVTSASIATKDKDFLYGRFETEMKPAKVSGVLSAFFLYRFDPWQEIDAEFVGRDTSKLLINVFYNPGEEGDLYNYGYRGTPVLVDLGFDASLDFHRYAIEWDPEEIRWFVDDKLVHRRAAGRPTPIPHLPMRFHVNAWPTCSEELAGPFDRTDLPASAAVKSVTISSWSPPSSTRFGSLFHAPKEKSGWRDEATWMQPGR